MIKKLMLTALVLTGFATGANAMDDAERARQMQLYSAQQQTGAAIVTTTTDTGTTAPAASAIAAAPAPAAAAAGAAKMAPLNDDGTPMRIATANLPAATGSSMSHERQLQAYEAYKAGQMAQSTTTTSIAAPVAAAPAVAPVMAPVVAPTPSEMALSNNASNTISPANGTVLLQPGQTVTTTTVEKTIETDYTKTQRKVGLVGNRPYPAQTTTLEGGVVKEVTVNGVTGAPEVLVPDTVAPVKAEIAEGDYFSNRKAAKVYNDANVHVHNTGRLNR